MQLRKKERNYFNSAVVACLPLVFISCKVDHFLNDNYSRLEVMEHTSALRIAMEDSSIAGSLSDLLEEFSKTNPDCDIYFMTGNIHEIQEGLTENNFDLGFVAAVVRKFKRKNTRLHLLC